VAQGLQQKMFEAELMLRRALKARFSDAQIVGFGGFQAAESATESQALQRKAAG
jgi:hypothetical protein